MKKLVIISLTFSCVNIFGGEWTFVERPNIISISISDEPKIEPSALQDQYNALTAYIAQSNKEFLSNKDGLQIAIQEIINKLMPYTEDIYSMDSSSYSNIGSVDNLKKNQIEIYKKMLNLSENILKRLNVYIGELSALHSWKLYRFNANLDMPVAVFTLQKTCGMIAQDIYNTDAKENPIQFNILLGLFSRAYKASHAQDDTQRTEYFQATKAYIRDVRTNILQPLIEILKTKISTPTGKQESYWRIPWRTPEPTNEEKMKTYLNQLKAQYIKTAPQPQQ